MKTRPHVASGNSAQARGKIADYRRDTITGLRIEKQAAAIKHLKKRYTSKQVDDAPCEV
jgi:hypothetical protein